MTDIKKNDRDRHRYIYWFEKCKAVGLIPQKYHDTEQELRDMYREHQEAKGRPVIPDENKSDSEPLSDTNQSTSVEEFYEVKKQYELDKDREWGEKLSENTSGSEGDIAPPSSYQREMLESGVSSLIFDRPSHKTKTLPMPDDSDKYLAREHIRENEKKQKSSWNF